MLLCPDAINVHFASMKHDTYQAVSCKLDQSQFAATFQSPHLQVTKCNCGTDSNGSPERLESTRVRADFE
eukprot:6178743-Pleurochrysis_carterae.AAC.2